MLEEKKTIFLDCDDTIMLSSETVIAILNKRYNENKTIHDLRDWYYRSIAGKVSQKEILEIYGSEEFWQELKLDQEFLNVFKELQDKYNWVFVSKGTPDNLLKKKQFLQKHFNEAIRFEGLPLESANDFDKSSVDMYGGIQIDDRIDCFDNTKAAVRILIHQNDVKWARPRGNEDNLYRVFSWKEAGDILRFFAEFGEFVTPCYTNEE